MSVPHDHNFWSAVRRFRERRGGGRHQEGALRTGTMQLNWTDKYDQLSRVFIDQL
jgi:hypothetical protein